jgi:transcriptional antiterminator RfaH
VRFTAGAFAGIEGVFQIAEGEKRVMVLIEMMSKPLSVRAAPSMLRKLG